MIKKLLTLLLVGSMAVSLTACLRSDPDYLKGMKESTAPTEVPSEERKWVLTDWSEEGLDELQAAVEKAGMPQLFGSERFDDGSFLNVTPKAIAEKTKIRVFKSVNENCSFLAMVDGQLYSIGKSGKYGFINQDGKEICPLKYDNVCDFYEGLAQVELNDKWGYINKDGQEVIPPKYDSTGNFSNGKARVRVGGILFGERFTIDKNGNIVE